jgi:hypothetical protein
MSNQIVLIGDEVLRFECPISTRWKSRSTPERHSNSKIWHFRTLSQTIQSNHIDNSQISDFHETPRSSTKSMIQRKLEKGNKRQLSGSQTPILFSQMLSVCFTKDSVQTKGDITSLTN